MIRTIIVDDEILSRIGIRSLLDGKEGIRVMGIFGGAAEALGFLRENVTDVVITDIEMADMSGLDLIAAIREEHLAPGIIILSCHDNFSYAQEAISKGTNSYILKMDLTEEILVREVQKVFRETSDERRLEKKKSDTREWMEDGTYVMAIPRVKAGKYGDETENLDSSMLTALLEEVISRYQMGTLFSPYNRETFIIFCFDRQISAERLDDELEQDLSVISANTEQYINGNLIFGVSQPFTELKESRQHYAQAKAAADLDFYGMNRKIYRWKPYHAGAGSFTFSAEQFTDAAGAEVFEKELDNACEIALQERIPADQFRNSLIQEIGDMTYQILHMNRLSREFTEQWNIGSRVVEIITEAKSLQQMKDSLIELFTAFHTNMRTELDIDECSAVFRYIRQNLDQKISLGNLADAACMSIPSISKKFKERTGLTITQYINRERIRHAQMLLKDPGNSLWQIAESTGFANVNYLIRVFKKVTGMTIGEYRKQIGVTAQEDDDEL